MRLRNRPQTPKPECWSFLAIRAAALALCLAGVAGAFEDPAPSKAGVSKPSPVYSPVETRLREDVTFLAADAREGRAPGTKGIEAAADFIAGVFKASGLKPAPGADGYFQPFSLSGVPSLANKPELTISGPDGKSIVGSGRTDFNPLAIGVAAALEKVPIVFAGYGITAHDEGRKLRYDDYADIDVKGKAVLIIRRKPREEDASSPFGGKQVTRYSSFQHKATNAFQHGAAAVLLVNDRGELSDGKETLLRFTQAGEDPFSNIPFVMVSRAFAGKILAGSGQPTLDELEEKIDADLKPRSRELEGWTLSERIAIDRGDSVTKNVIGVLEGIGPHAEETVIIGGHYDHLGRGGLMSGSLALLSSDIHNGADDNASGTSMVLEMARRLGARRDPLPRRVVFIAFSGEERGLLGSKYYVQHPLFPLSSTVMMFNCDMVGRLNAKNELTMIGTGTSPGLGSLVDVLGKSAGLTIKQVSGMTDGFGGSDHQSFYPKGIPVLFAFTGVHRDYHRPSDDSHLINYAGMARIADYLELLLLDVIRRPERPALARVTAPTHGGGGTDPARMGSGVYVGTRPDYSYEAKDGMRIDGVSEGSPAEKGGLKGGDIITRFGNKPVGTVYDFMESMSQYKPGEKVEIVVKRDGKDVKLQVTLGSRPGR
ncbi:MAG: M28 family peptidase [Isosphaeraceae bacterium]